MSQQAQDDFYGDPAELALAYAAAVNDEARDLKAAGADIIQIDEPYLQARPEAAREYAIPAINRALAGIEGPTALHICFGYAAIVHNRPTSGYAYLGELGASDATQVSIESAQPKLDYGVLADLEGKDIILGTLDLGDPEVETPEAVAARIRAALKFAPAGRLTIAPDCGMKYLPRATAFGKLRAMVDGAAVVRAELG
jgi:5-methyltetrahydropteroyltriglutamate--homocysteine methyltransferase